MILMTMRRVFISKYIANAHSLTQIQIYTYIPKSRDVFFPLLISTYWLKSGFRSYIKVLFLSIINAMTIYD